MVIAWHSHIIKHQVAIVDSVVAELLADVAYFDSWQRLMCTDLPDLNHKRLQSIVIAKSDTSSKDNCIISLTAEAAWPELCCLNCR